MADVYHVNFHTFQNRPIFLDESFAIEIRNIFVELIEADRIACLASAIMPTHVHLVVICFPDQSRAKVIQLLKGASSRLFLREHPEIHDELGGRLWQPGYDWVLVDTAEQCHNAVRYVNSNRNRLGLGTLPSNQSR